MRIAAQDFSPLPQSDIPINRKNKDNQLYSSLLDILDEHPPLSLSTYDFSLTSSHGGAGYPNSEDSSLRDSKD